MNEASAGRLRDVVVDEIDRAMAQMRIPGHPRPHYLSCLVRHEEHWEIEARYGTPRTDTHSTTRECYCDVRVGSYASDQVEDGGLKEEEDDSRIKLPFGDEGDGLRHGLWRLIDERYRSAVGDLLHKQSNELDYVDVNAEFPSFEQRDGVVDWNWSELPAFDCDAWRAYVERASLVPKRFSQIKSSDVTVDIVRRTQVFVNSEGARILDRRFFWTLTCGLGFLSPEGDDFSWTISHYVPHPAELPTEPVFHAEIADAIESLERLARAPRLNGYSGPVLLEPAAAGLLMHEALGHRLEGNRFLDTESAQTFRDAVGESIVPPFLSMYDDPTLQRFGDRSLVGHYRFDDEGVPAERADLIRDGKVCGFLTSRAGIAPNHRSNGHGRNERCERPISRMGVTVVEAKDGLDDAALRQALIDEVRRQGLPYGIRIIRAVSGETTTEAYDFQAFLGSIDLAARVFPDGREELVRGVDFVGTPLNAVRSIMAAGQRSEVDNALCGAESGWVPVSTVSPALLLSHLELQGKAETPVTQYAYPMPWVGEGEESGK